MANIAASRLTESEEPWRNEGATTFHARTIRIDGATFVAECWAERRTGKNVEAEESQRGIFATEREAIRWIVRTGNERGFEAIKLVQRE